jgi:hypothetical protein
MTDRPIGDVEITNAMARFGGSFAWAIAAAAQRADPTNLARLKAAFPELWNQYAELALRQREAEKDRS